MREGARAAGAADWLCLRIFHPRQFGAKGHIAVPSFEGGGKASLDLTEQPSRVAELWKPFVVRDARGQAGFELAESFVLPSGAGEPESGGMFIRGSDAEGGEKPFAESAKVPGIRWNQPGTLGAESGLVSVIADAPLARGGSGAGAFPRVAPVRFDLGLSRHFATIFR